MPPSRDGSGVDGGSLDRGRGRGRGRSSGNGHQGPPPPYSTDDDSPRRLSMTPGTFSLPRVHVTQATDDEAQQNPLYGAAVDFIY